MWRGVPWFHFIDRFWFWIVCVGALRGVSGVWHWSEMPGSVSQPWFGLFSLLFFCFVLFFEEWYLHPPPHPVCLFSLCLHHSSFLHRCPVRLVVGQRLDVWSVCCIFLFVYGTAHVDGAVTLSVSFHVDWRLPLHPSVSVFSLSSSSCMMCTSIGGAFLIRLAASGACWMVRSAHLWWCDALLIGCL